MGKSELLSQYRGNLAENTTWFHGTRFAHCESILAFGIKNGQKALPDTLARGPEMSMAERFGGGSDGVLFIIQTDNATLCDVGSLPKPMETHSLNGKVNPENIYCFITTEVLRDITDRLIHDIRMHYSDGIDSGGAYVEELSNILFLHAKKRDQLRMSLEESTQLACEFIWNQIEMCLQDDLLKIRSNLNELFANDEDHVPLRVPVLKEVMTLYGPDTNTWRIQDIESESLNTNHDVGLNTWIMVYCLLKVQSFWKYMNPIQLAYTEIQAAYQSEINDVARLGKLVEKIIEEARK